MILLALDSLLHGTIGNSETLIYYLAKPFLAGGFAFLTYKGFLNFLYLKKNSHLYYLLSATIFALAHGIYYRLFEYFTGALLFSRVGDVMIGSLVLSGFYMTTLAWWIIHGGSFYIGLLIAKMVFK